ncbi:MAG: N-acetyltransferase [Polyangiaceae bacterium]|nr:N-acetyltransferase [Polyangiaceae bacterium]
MHVEIRREDSGDEAAIHALHAAAFGTDAEARCVEALRAGGALTLSLVSLSDGEVVGHIAFSPVVVEAGGRLARGIGLAPMAVAPGRQRRGIGGRLIAAGLAASSAEGHGFCVVLGHPGYYPRHGFVPARAHGIRWERGHDEALFVQALAPDGLAGVSGILRYRPELDAV